MTRYLLDVASYQGALPPAAVKAAGFSAVNLKISHGLTRKSVHPNVAGWVDAARELGLGICTFHYLTADAAGEQQAEFAYGMLRALGLDFDAAHQLDVESSPAPTLSSVRGYLAQMTHHLGRPVALYTGDWWWKPKRWDVSDLTPYVWSAPNAGYLGSYPGDTSSHWTAGYGGWPELAIMQYAVKPLAGIDVSMSAIRDETVWTALTGGTVATSWVLVPSLVTLRTEFNTLAPRRDKGADGAIGDSAHTSSSDHTPDEISSVLRDHDGDSKNEVHALDIDSTGPWPGTGTQKERFHRIVMRVIAGERAKWKDASDRCRLNYVIWDRKIYDKDNDFAPRDYTGSDPHTNHAHFSNRYETGSENDTRPWGVAEGDDDDMPLTDADIAKVAKAVWGFDPGNDANGETNGGVKNPDYDGKDNKNATVQPVWSLYRALITDKVVYQNRDKLDQALAALAKILANVTADDGEAQQIISQIRQAQEQTVADVLGGLGGSGKSDAEIAAALTAALGPRASAVAALIR